MYHRAQRTSSTYYLPTVTCNKGKFCHLLWYEYVFIAISTLWMNSIGCRLDFNDWLSLGAPELKKMVAASKIIMMSHYAISQNIDKFMAWHIVFCVFQLTSCIMHLASCILASCILQLRSCMKCYVQKSKLRSARGLMLIISKLTINSQHQSRLILCVVS